jgi:predicted alpha/beta-hydrolase family hydrolase
MGSIFLLPEGPEDAGITIALAHGAGAPMDSPFMAAFSAGLAAQDYRVVRFEFPYMAGRRDNGIKRPPDRPPVLFETWKTVIEHLGADGLVIGGKSMGGRIASMVADETNVRGMVCLGYPFHAPGREADARRLDHMATIKTPTLIVQGERDALGNADEVAGYSLSSTVRLHWLADGDHSFKPRKKSGRTEDENWAAGIDAVARFVAEL